MEDIMLECPFCNTYYNEKAWGMHTITCEKNPKNITVKVVKVKDKDLEKKAKRKLK
jgi:hypothetical protein